MTESNRESWLSYLSRGRLGSRDESVTIPRSLPIPKGPGLHRIYEPIDALVDIVFVHGLTGSSKTWYEPHSRTFWPSDLLPKDIPPARIFIWEYDADVFKNWINHHASGNKLLAHGSNLCNRLAGNRYKTSTQRRPIIFICHSLGGLVVQKALLHSDESPDVLYNDIVDSTAGIVFLGTPHRGSTLANWGGLGTDFAHVVKDVNQAIVKLLKPGNEILLQLRDSFLKLVIRRAQQHKQALKIKCYIEELGMTLIGKIVTEESAIFEGYPFGSIHADHVKMTKFGYQNGVVDQAYTDVIESICIMIDHAKKFYSPQRTLDSSLSRQRSSLAVQGVAENQQSSLPFGLLPDNVENIHHPMTALATWNSGQATPSQNFKSFAHVRLPTKRARVSSSLTSLVASSEVSKAQNMPFSLKMERSGNPKDYQQEISNIVDSQIADHKLFHTGQSTGQKTMISDWLSTINHQEMHNFKCSQRYRETGVWLSIAPEFRYWRDTSQSSLFWLHGRPGVGKSVLSSFVIDALSANKDVTVLYFYCRSKPFQNHMSILRSLLKQIYLRTDRKALVEDFYSKHKDDTPCDGDESIIQSYYQLFLEIVPTSRTYIVLDGVDECTADGIEDLMNAWKFVSRRSRRVIKLLVSGRQTEIVQASIGREIHLAPQVNVHLSLDSSSGQNSDLESYIDGQIEEVAKQWDMWRNSGWQEVLGRAKSLLMERASGSFLWVRLALESLQSSAKDSEATLETTPSSIITFYEQHIAAVASDTPLVASIAEKTLYWLNFALEPLRARDIAFAISMGLDQADEKLIQPVDGAYLAQCCKGLVTFREESDELCLVHQSAREFLCQKLDNSLAHAYLGKTCLLALTTMARQDDSSGSSLSEGRAMSGEEGLFAYARRKYLIHGFQALSLDQRIGPWIDADEVGFLSGGCSSNRLKRKRREGGET